MKPYSPNVDEILSRALITAFLGILGTVALTFVLSVFGITANDRYVFLGMMAYNLIPTWHIVRAVKMLGKNPWIYGGISILGIPFSLFMSSILIFLDSFHLLKTSYGIERNEA